MNPNSKDVVTGHFEILCEVLDAAAFDVAATLPSETIRGVEIGKFIRLEEPLPPAMFDMNVAADSTSD